MIKCRLFFDCYITKKMRIVNPHRCNTCTHDIRVKTGYNISNQIGFLLKCISFGRLLCIDVDRHFRARNSLGPDAIGPRIFQMAIPVFVGGGPEGPQLFSNILHINIYGGDTGFYFCPPRFWERGTTRPPRKKTSHAPH